MADTSRPLSDVKGVLFDFYGTLARAVSWGETHEEVFARRGLAEAGSLWGSRWVGGVPDGHEHVEHSVSRDAYRAWELERLRSRARACGVGDDELEALVADLYQATKTFTLAAYPEVPDVLAELRRRGLVVAVCSNWDWDLDLAIAQAGLTDAVDVVVTSARAGARKPHRRIFDHTLDRCGLEASQALFAGDTWVPDVEGPLAAGMRPVHVWRGDRADEPEPPPLVDGVVRAADLSEILLLV